MPSAAGLFGVVGKDLSAAAFRAILEEVPASQDLGIPLSLRLGLTACPQPATAAHKTAYT